MKFKSLFSLFIVFLIPLTTLAAEPISPTLTTKEITSLQLKISECLTKYPTMFRQWMSQSERKVKLMEVKVDPQRNRVELYFNYILAQIAIREPLVAQWEQMVKDTLSASFKADYKGTTVALYSSSIPIERFIPNIYREKIKADAKRNAKPYDGVPLIANKDKGFYGKGLSMRHIALWPSHGAYFSAEDTAWIWQRPALFGYVEDLNSYEYCYRYLIPMLENAGAVVISPRERAVADREYVFKDNILKPAPYSKSYALKGVARGVYGISVRYNAVKTNISKATYTITHNGGVSEIEVNQRMGGGMWIFLGEFDVDKNSKIELTGAGAGTISSTGIRVGGGMGDIERGGSVSGAPRWAEAARYSMEYNGVPEQIYAQQTLEDKEDKDYVDDYKSRGDWVNWVKEGRNIPLDAALTLHTNAGINDSIFGTLTIHYTKKGRGTYGDGSTKFAGRDFADMMLTQIVEDIWAKYTPQWTRRSIYDKSYAEISRPNVPAVIVELFSHQNKRDVDIANTPQFRFSAARSIYKGVLKYLAQRYNTAYVVQPLPISDFEMTMASDTAVVLRWRATVDALEPTATPKSYKIYTRVDDGAFDNGRVVYKNVVTIPIAYDSLQRSYKITALNDGGESFGSEVLSCGFLSPSTKVVTVSNECRELSLKMPYLHDLGYVGAQYDFDPLSQFVDNENPGYGASKKDKATIGRKGETFDNTIKKGRQELKNGNSYVSLPSEINIFTK